MKDFGLNFLLRIVFGAIAIYLCNSLLSDVFGVPIHLGLNVLNLLMIGILGVSGFGLTFGIAIFSVL